MFCLGTNKIQLGYTIFESGTIFTAFEVYAMDPPASESSKSGHSSGAPSPGIDDPDRCVFSERLLPILRARIYLQDIYWEEKILFHFADLSSHPKTFLQQMKC